MNIECWQNALQSFPASVQDVIDSARTNGGKLEAMNVGRLLEEFGTEIGTLMIQLLPVAQAFAIVPISGYPVGAVSQGVPEPETGWSSLYLGANVEFRSEALSFSVHAEQSATTNAWLSGELGLRSLAISAAPCGYCRQFLYELVTGKQLDILLPTGTGDQYKTNSLDYFLPDAFGPHDLKIDGGLMDPRYCSHNLNLKKSSMDPLILTALEAAKSSYAPYTCNYSGCAVETSDGVYFPGRYAENAAYNPSMSPLESAITFMNMSLYDGEPRTVQRVALVEVPSKASQKGVTEDVLSSFAPGVTLDYAEATTV